MKIRPLPEEVQLKIEEAKAGILDTSSRESAVEYAEVLAVGDSLLLEETGIKKGDYVFVKSWAIDIISHEDKKYYFVNISTKGIKAIVYPKEHVLR